MNPDYRYGRMGADLTGWGRGTDTKFLGPIPGQLFSLFTLVVWDRRGLGCTDGEEPGIIIQLMFFEHFVSGPVLIILHHGLIEFSPQPCDISDTMTPLYR